jgi:hypothetical protein
MSWKYADNIGIVDCGFMIKEPGVRRQNREGIKHRAQSMEFTDKSAIIPYWMSNI